MLFTQHWTNKDDSWTFLIRWSPFHISLNRISSETRWFGQFELVWFMQHDHCDCWDITRQASLYVSWKDKILWSTSNASKIAVYITFVPSAISGIIGGVICPKWSLRSHETRIVSRSNIIISDFPDTSRRVTYHTTARTKRTNERESRWVSHQLGVWHDSPTS